MDMPISQRMLSQDDVEAIAVRVREMLKEPEKPKRAPRAPLFRETRPAPIDMTYLNSDVTPKNAAKQNLPQPMIGALLAIWERGGIRGGGGRRTVKMGPGQ